MPEKDQTSHEYYFHVLDIAHVASFAVRTTVSEPDLSEIYDRVHDEAKRDELGLSHPSEYLEFLCSVALMDQTDQEFFRKITQTWPQDVSVRMLSMVTNQRTTAHPTDEHYWRKPHDPPVDQLKLFPDL